MRRLADYRKFTLALGLIPRVGSGTILKLLAETGDIAELYSAVMDDNMQGLGQKLDWQVADTMIATLAEHNIEWHCIWEEDYPSLLKQITDPPAILYGIGDWSILASPRSLAVVGTRKVTEMGRNLTTKLVKDITQKGFIIVSGMAMGIDSEAHLACIAAGGKTVAVLASPPHIASPSSNWHVYKQILAHGGCIVSEFLPGVEIRGGMFASRNRIIAGLSQGTLVVEAGQKSGALITADLALNYDREVFAVPGNIDQVSSEGCNNLIKTGAAKLVQDASDILSEFNIKNVPETVQQQLDPQMQRLHDVLRQEAKLLDEIMNTFDTKVGDVISLLTNMEILGLIYQREDGRYSIK